MRTRANVLAWLLAAAASVVWAAPAELYVSPAGNDAWSGQLPSPNAAATDGPFATLVRARDAVRQLRAATPPPGPVTVRVREGTYALAEPLVFGPADSGTAAAPVTYAAYPGEHPVLSGGRVLTGFRREADGRFTLAIPEARAHGWVFRQLFVNGQRRPLAHSPNEGYYHIRGRAAPAVDPASGKPVDRATSAFRCQPGDLRAWDGLRDVELLVYQIWETSWHPAKSVDEASGTVELTGPAKWEFGWAGADQRYVVYNHPGALDAPGEWQLDRQTGTLTVIPLPGEDLATATVVAPRTPQLLVLRGDPEAGLPVEHLRFVGLSFQHTDWPLPPEGHGDWQAAVTVDAAIQANGARACAIEGCEVAHTGNYAIWFESACVDNRVVQNHLHDLGAGGVRIGQAGSAPAAEKRTHGNRVESNFIHDGGHVHAGAIGVWVGQSSDNEIVHNEICDLNYTGISVGWSWGYSPTDCHRNRIAFNHLHHLGQGVLSDMGAIYTLGISTGTVVANNLIHDVWGYEKYGAAGIYPDEGSTGIVIENNVVYRTVAGGFSIHYGQQLVARNNVFVLGRDYQVSRGRADKDTTSTFERNIVCYAGDTLYVGTGTLTADRNLYFRTDGGPVTFPGDQTLAQWQAAGQDTHSVVADPRFVDPAADDFGLRADAPALALGFVPIDTRTCGLVGDAAWVDLPRRIQRTYAGIPPRPEPTPQFVEDSFEDDPPGTTAANAVTWGEADSASVRISADTAAEGKQSLKFQDAPGLDQPWNPHLWYTPRLVRGVVRARFDLRIEPGANVCCEWRDDANPYHVGPSLEVDADGRVLVAKEPVAQLAPGHWARFELTCALGSQATGTWNLTVTPAGQPPVQRTGLTCQPTFKALHWLGFISNATTATVFYLDNVRIELAGKP